MPPSEYGPAPRRRAPTLVANQPRCSRRNSSPSMSPWMSVSPRTARSRTTVCGPVNAGSGLAGQRHVAGIGGVANFHESEQIHVVLCEAVKVLEEQLQLLTGQRLVVSPVAHGLTIRLTGPSTATSLRTTGGAV